MGFMKKLQKKAKKHNPVPSIPHIPPVLAKPKLPIPIVHIPPIKPHISPPPPPKAIIHSIDKAVIKPIDVAVIKPTEHFVNHDIVKPTKNFTEDTIDTIKDVIKDISDIDLGGSKGKGHKNKSNDEGGEFNTMWYYVGGAAVLGGYFML